MLADPAHNLIFIPTDCILDPSAFAILKRKKHGVDSNQSVMQFLEEKYDLKFHKLKKAATADALGTGPRCVIFERSDRVVEAIISQEPEMLPSVWKGAGWETIAHARCGGVMVNNPGGITYGDYKA